ncbi:hypothetical protein BSLA_01f2707 [Burkholderia stabilis]|nr:hypothetical protein BSLA_01f2707 [Burkholderia stabilis]
MKGRLLTERGASAARYGDANLANADRPSRRRCTASAGGTTKIGRAPGQRSR